MAPPLLAAVIIAIHLSGWGCNFHQTGCGSICKTISMLASSTLSTSRKTRISLRPLSSCAEQIGACLSPHLSAHDNPVYNYMYQALLH